MLVFGDRLFWLAAELGRLRRRAPRDPGVQSGAADPAGPDGESSGNLQVLVRTLRAASANLVAVMDGPSGVDGDEAGTLGRRTGGNS